MSDCFEKACAEGTLACGSASYRRSLEFQGGSFDAVLHDPMRDCSEMDCHSERSEESRPDPGWVSRPGAE
jgi:hypothetical protein